MNNAEKKLNKIAIQLLLFLFKGLIILKKIITFLFLLIKKILFFVFKLCLHIGGKKIILTIYKTYLFTKRAVSKIFLPAKNKFLYPFINKETIHIIIIILALFICFENVKLKITHAQNTEEIIGKDNILASFAAEELEGEFLIEEKVESNEDMELYQKTEYVDIKSFGVKSTQEIGTSTDETNKNFQNIKTKRKEILSYVVKAGDVIGAIAEKFTISANTILWANNLSYYSIIRPGDTLKILPVSGTLHTVSSGENLSSIGNRYNISVEKIKEYNNLANADQIKKGLGLIIPNGVKQTTSRTTALASAQTPYTLKKIITPTNTKYSKSSGFIWPTTSRRITQYYHWKHHAIDIGAKKGTPIYSIEKGQIIFSGWSTGYGYNILVDHGGGQKSRYAHFSKLYVKKGTLVNKGQQLGEMGSTGWSTGPHLHIEIIINGVKVNPLKYIK